MVKLSVIVTLLNVTFAVVATSWPMLITPLGESYVTPVLLLSVDLTLELV